MATPGGTPAFLDTTAEAFLTQRLQRRRVRASAVHQRESAAAATAAGATEPVPPMSIVIMIVGSRGDVQPFIPIGQRLAERHRVRIATHRVFRSLVEDAGLEFY